MGFGACVSAAVSVFHNNTSMPMVGVMTGCVFLALFILLVSQRVIAYQREHKTIDESMAKVAL